MALKVKVLEKVLGKLSLMEPSLQLASMKNYLMIFPRLVPCLLIQTWKCKKKNCSGLYR